MDEISPQLIDSGIVFIAGALASISTAIINKAWWTSKRRQYVSLGVSMTLGIIATVLKGLFNPPPAESAAFITWIVTSLGLVAGISQLVYMQFSEKLKEIEDATSPAPPVEDEEDYVPERAIDSQEQV